MTGEVILGKAFASKYYIEDPLNKGTSVSVT